MRHAALIIAALATSPAHAGPDDWTAAFQTCTAGIEIADDLMACLATYAVACAEESTAAGTDVSDGRCPDGEAMLWEEEMNRAQAAAEGRIAQHAGAVDALVAAQSVWMDFRNKACTLERLTAGPDGFPDVIESYCHMQMTAERTIALSWIGIETSGEGE